MGVIKEYIEDALREIIVLSEGEQPSADQINDGLKKFRQMVQAWSWNGLMIPVATTEAFTLSSAKSSYAWKPGGDFNSATPSDIEAVSFTLGNYQHALDRLDSAAMLNLPNLANVAEPKFYSYEQPANAAGAGVMTFNVTPYGGSLRVVSHKPFSSTFILTDNSQFPDAYDELLRTNLAVRLAPANGKNVSTELAFIAKSSLAMVMSHNQSAPPQMRSNLPTQRRRSNPLPFRSA